jgi:hypothetical protein
MNRESKRLVLVGLLLLLSLSLTACDDPGLVEELFEMGMEWADQRKLISVDEEGNIGVNYVQVGLYEAERRWTGTTGDSNLDAALIAGPVVKSVAEADALANEGMRNRDPAKLDEAIKARPGDWNYHDQKGAILGINGSSDEALASFASSEQLVEARINDGGSCRGLYQNMLRGRINALREQHGNDPDNVFVDAALKQAEQQMAALNGNAPGNVCAGR